MHSIRAPIRRSHLVALPLYPPDHIRKKDARMQQRGKHTRNFYRSRPYARPRRVPALSTGEAAALVLQIIAARLTDGWSLEQLNWPRYCRDSAVEQLVRQSLEQARCLPHGD